MPTISTLDTEYLTRRELAEFLRCSVRTIDRMLADGSGPPPVRSSAGRVIFSITAVREWAAKRTAPVKA